MRSPILFGLTCIFFAACSRGSDEALSVTELAEMVRQAHQAEDLEALHRLVCWDGVDEGTRSRFDSHALSSFGHDVQELSEEPVLVTEVVEIEFGELKYRPNLRPVGRLRFTWNDDESQPTLQSYLVGVKEGRYFISSFSPTP